ncbi:MAG: 16S rRNA processing protein RimM [Deltaproteobacteria bacterium]|nr:16S rRNA processing protein RimM [Deltaproteobacteria bacterium]
MAATWQVLGKIVKPHGLRGDLKVVFLGENLENLERPGIHLRFPDGRLQPAVMEYRRPVKGGHLFRLAGCDSIAEAEKLVPAEVVIRAADLPPLPPGEYYHFQLLGLRVRDAAGEDLGMLAEIIATGGHDVYVIRHPEAGELLVPAVAAFIVRIDLEAGEMVVDRHLLQEG